MLSVIWNPGHGGQWPQGDPGTVRVGMQEDDIVYQICKRCHEYSLAHGLHSQITRKDNQAMSLADIVAVANHSKADVFISVHLNSSNDPTAHGAQTFYCSAKGQAVAILVQSELTKTGIFTNRGITDKGYYVIKHTTMPAILVEAGFLSNNEDRTHIDDNLDWNAIAGALVRGVIAWGRQQNKL